MTDRNALVSAALRHIRDAEHLLSCPSGSSEDQAYHLAGFAPECARKACLAQDWLNRVLGHDLKSTSDDVLNVALSLDIQAHRYGLQGLAQRFPELSGWSPQARYRKTGTTPSNLASRVVSQARQVTDELITELWLNGCVSEEVLGQ